MRGKLITIEGPDLCGKSSQVPLLVGYLQNLGIKAIQFNFPQRGTLVGDIIDRHLKGKIWLTSGLSESDNTTITKSADDPLAFQCLMAADKYVAATKIMNLLDSGTTVITDRWWPSAVVYGSSDDVDYSLLVSMNKFLPEADLNILFCISSAEFARRLESRPDKRDRYDTPEKFETISKLYHNFWSQRASDSRWVKFTADHSLPRVHKELCELVTDYFPISLGSSL